MRRSRVLYLEVAEQLRRAIFSEKYPVGSLLPTETDFEREFGVSKITIRQAIELLANDELVEKRSGRGTTVPSDRPYNKLSKTTSLTQILETSDARVEKQVLGLETVDLASDDELRSHFGASAVRFRRLYLLTCPPAMF